MADRKHGESAPPTDTTVRHEDWDGRDLSGAEHTRVEFIDVDLTEATGKGAVFIECTFRDCRFNASVHRLLVLRRDLRPLQAGGQHVRPLHVRPAQGRRR